MRNSAVLKVAISGMLIGVGIVIPLFSPLKIMLEPASFTFASHVSIFIAMFISPYMAVAVAVGTAIGFFANFPLVIGFRAATHIIFAFFGALYLRHNPKITNSIFSLRVFSFCIAVIHALPELAVSSLFYFNGGMSDAYYDRGYVVGIVFLVGIGTVIHSMVDFEISRIVLFPLKKQQSLKHLFVG
jgi:niacin transporter